MSYGCLQRVLCVSYVRLKYVLCLFCVCLMNVLCMSMYVICMSYLCLMVTTVRDNRSVCCTRGCNKSYISVRILLPFEAGIYYKNGA